MSAPTCGSTATVTGKPCRAPAGRGTDHPGRGRCYRHEEGFLASIRHPMKRAFLRLIAKRPNITWAAEQIGMDRDNHYNWMKADPYYPDAFESAKEAGIDHLEERGLGWVEAVDSPDKVSPAIAKVWQFLLQVHRYKPTLQVETVDTDKIIDALRRAGDREGLERIAAGESPTAVLHSRLGLLGLGEETDEP